MHLQTFKNLQDEVLSWLDEAGDTGTSLTNVKNALNQAQQMRLAKPWSFALWPREETITCVAGQRVYTLHPEVWRLHTLYNRGTKKFLTEVPPRSVSDTNVAPTDTQRASLFRMSGVTCVAAQPASASVLTIVSSDAGDTGATYGVTVKGSVGGVPLEEVIVPSGTTPVAGTLSFQQITEVVKAGTWAGTLTMTADAGATAVLTLTDDESGRQYPTIELLALPETTDVIAYRFYRQPSKMVGDNTIPMIPAPHAQILVWDALLLFAGYNTDLSEKSIAMWTRFQSQMEEDLLRVWQEGGTHAARARFVRRSSDDDAGNGNPVIFA